MTYEGADEVKNNCCLFERLFRVKKNKVFRFEIEFFSLQRYLCFRIMQMRKVMTTQVVPLKQYITESSVSGAFMITLLFFQTIIYSRRLKITELLVLFSASGFRSLHPSSLERIGKHVALIKWRHCVAALIFLSGIFSS